MNGLPMHGRVTCTDCFTAGGVEFDRTRLEGDGWRITSNPLAWGSATPEIVVLGFSKGPTQAGPCRKLRMTRSHTRVGDET